MKGRQVANTETLPFTRKNQIIFASGMLMIVLGFFLLSRNSITLAPLLLVFGYCVVIPLAIVAK
ncbi:MAG: hypothetical protein ACKVU1_13850 [bacterium]